MRTLTRGLYGVSKQCPTIDYIYLTYLFIALSLFFQGFGAGNFKSLFEAIEQDQAQRGNLY